MQKDHGVVVMGRFVEQHGLKGPNETDAQTGSIGSGASPGNGAHSMLECLSAGRKFARQCEIEGVADRGFRRT
jgi:hypothetical protein